MRKYTEDVKRDAIAFVTEQSYTRDNKKAHICGLFDIVGSGGRI